MYAVSRWPSKCTQIDIKGKHHASVPANCSLYIGELQTIFLQICHILGITVWLWTHTVQRIGEVTQKIGYMGISEWWDLFIFDVSSLPREWKINVPNDFTKLLNIFLIFSKFQKVIIWFWFLKCWELEMYSENIKNEEISSSKYYQIPKFSPNSSWSQSSCVLELACVATQTPASKG